MSNAHVRLKVDNVLSMKNVSNNIFRSPLSDLSNDHEASRNNVRFMKMLQNMLDEMFSIGIIHLFVISDVMGKESVERL